MFKRRNIRNIIRNIIISSFFDPLTKESFNIFVKKIDFTNRNTKIIYKNFDQALNNWILHTKKNEFALFQIFASKYRVLSMKISRSVHNFLTDIFTLFVIFCALLFVCSRKRTIWRAIGLGVPVSRNSFRSENKIAGACRQPCKLFPHCQNTKINYSSFRHVRYFLILLDRM